MSLARSPLITVMTAAARKAARSLLHDYREVEQLQVSVKGTNDFVSEADLRAERILGNELSRARPGYDLLMEESGAHGEGQAEFRWVVDPLDGTSNFLHALPYFCISIACEQRLPTGGYVPVAAVIYDPLHDDLFVAEKGKGAFHNDRRMQVSRRQEIEQALFVTAAPRLGRAGSDEALKLYGAVSQRSMGVRTMGATALDLAYVAAGRFDGCWYRFFHRWDIAAGMLLVQEAGGIVTQMGGDTDLREPQTLVAANPVIHKKLGVVLDKVR
jgi:myo-inositol-1(or 4)-monophosphatase